MSTSELVLFNIWSVLNDGSNTFPGGWTLRPVEDSPAYRAELSCAQLEDYVVDAAKRVVVDAANGQGWGAASLQYVTSPSPRLTFVLTPLE